MWPKPATCGKSNLILTIESPVPVGRAGQKVESFMPELDGSSSKGDFVRNL